MANHEQIQKILSVQSSTCLTEGRMYLLREAIAPKGSNRFSRGVTVPEFIKKHIATCLFVLLLYVPINSYGHGETSVHLTTLFPGEA